MTASLAPGIWASQHLDRETRDPLTVADDVLGVYGTAPTCYLSLAARTRGLTIAAVDDLVYERRLLVRARCTRGSVYLLPHRLLVVATTATREKNVQAFRAMLLTRLGPDGYETWAERIEDVLAGGPLGAREIREALDPPREVGGLLKYVVANMAAEARLVRATVRGGWRSDLHAYARWEDWLPDVDPHALTVRAAQTELAMRYFTAYAPSTLADFRWWSGINTREARAAIARAGVAPAGHGPHGPLLAMPGPHAEAETPPVRLLPVWDLLLVAYRHRERLVADRVYQQVYDASGNATSTVLVAGKVAGVWDLGDDEDPLQIKVAPFDRFSRAVWAEVEAEAARIGELAGAATTRVIRCGPPPNLAEGRRNLFMSPLKHAHREHR